MNTYIALLRGINVSGYRTIGMADLRRSFEDNGFRNVRTYIQSGNVIFEYQNNSIKEILEKISDFIEEEFGFTVPVIVLKPDAIEKALDESVIFIGEDLPENKTFIIFLTEEPTFDRVLELSETPVEGARFYVGSKTIHFATEGGFSGTKLNTNFFERKLKVSGTARNIKTLKALLKLIGK